MKLLYFLVLVSIYAEAQTIVYPETKTVAVSDTYFGKTVADPYRWLEYDTTDDVQEWRKQQNQFAEKYLKKSTSRFRIQSEMFEFANVKFYTPVTKNQADDVFYFQNDGGLGTCLYLKRHGVHQVVMRPNKYGRHKSVSFFAVSKDGKQIAVGLSDSGSDWNEVRIRNLEKEENYPEVIGGIKFDNVVWRADGFYYCRYSLPGKAQLLTAKNVGVKVFYHKLGEEQEKDQLIYSEDIPNSQLHIRGTSDGRFLIIYGNDVRDQQPYSKVMYVDLWDTTFTKPQTFLLIPQADITVVDSYADSLYVVSDYKAPKKQIFTCNPKKPNKLNLIVREKREPLEQAAIINHKLVCLYRQNANFLSVVYSLNGTPLHVMDFPPGSNVTGFRGTKSQTSTVYRFSSFTFPPVTYKYDLQTFKAQPSELTSIRYDYTQFVTNQEFYVSKDGTKIPIYIVYKKNLQTNGNNPCLLYGYGGFGHSMTPFYDPGLIYFLEKGGVLAAPCIRGGGEYGEAWHKGGSLLNKQNSFDDFIAAAEYMITKNYTNSKKLAMMGASNGGLLVGAVMTQHPELFRAVVGKVGVYDMLRYQNYTIGHAWSDEYGLSSDSIQFNSLIKYSPLHNVKKVNYPSTLLITGDHDDRVPPMHSYKFAAALQKNNAGSNPVLLLVNKFAGHSGPEEFDEFFDEQAFTFGFILNELTKE